jgi:soluble lytic murein transglycosylase-like protein
MEQTCRSGVGGQLLRARTTLILGSVILAAVQPFGPLRADAQVRSANRACLFERPARPDIERICIRKNSYSRDVCRAIERVASEQKLPPEFFARLIWRESLFRADAISPKGAEGIAQFMPGTAKLRGLKDSFDVAQALDASSLYLRELRHRFGNLGLAAAAYNAGESRLSKFLAGGGLPLETRDYVFAITGSPVETWRDEPPAKAAEPLDPKRSFLSACIRLAISRNLPEPILVGSLDWAPWQVQLAANFNPAIARKLMAESMSRLPPPLNAEHALIVRQKRPKPGMRPKYQARIGRNTRQEAIDLCDAIHRAGVACAVVKNGR